jgi:hypothetical protein
MHLRGVASLDGAFEDGRGFDATLLSSADLSVDSAPGITTGQNCVWLIDA